MLLQINSCSCHCDELVRRLSLDCLHDNANRPSSRIELLTCNDLHVPLITLVNRLQYIKEELCRTVSVIAVTNEQLTKRTSSVQSRNSPRR